jgi:Ca-activated chloride channel homolog
MIMRLPVAVLLLFSVVCISNVRAQTVFSTKDLNLGDLYTTSERFGDILVTNKGARKSYILRVEKPTEVVYLASTDALLPDSSLSFRLQVNPKEKGAFAYTVKIYTSDSAEPSVVRIKGNVREYAADDYASLQSCPTFGSEPSRVKPNDVTIITVDAETGKPLAQTTVTLIRNGQPVGAWITGRKGTFEQETTPGYFYFAASRDGYLPYETGVYVSPKVNQITIPLRQDPSYPAPSNEPVIAAVPEQTIVIPAEKAEEIIEARITPPVTDSVIQRERPELASLDPNDFSETNFKPVNVVFILDVSSSMRGNEKLDLMKYALNQLVGSLRSEDHISLVTYSDDAEVLLEPTSCSNREKIMAQVAELNALGQTAGGKGIKTGYSQALKQYSADKANMVIIITDGAFNRGNDDYKKQVAKHADKGITFSVVGIKDSERDEKVMREAADFGKGRYIPIDRLADAQHNLLQEIRIAAYRK